MKLRSVVSVTLAFFGLVLGTSAALSNGTREAVGAFGRSAIIAGAIILAGWLISSAIAESQRRDTEDG